MTILQKMTVFALLLSGACTQVQVERTPCEIWADATCAKWTDCVKGIGTFDECRADAASSCAVQAPHYSMASAMQCEEDYETLQCSQFPNDAYVASCDIRR